MSRESETIANGIMGVLKDLFPNVEMDYLVVARLIVEKSNLASVKEMEAREGALQEALSATMDYMGKIHKSLHRRIAELESERDHLTERLCKLEKSS